MSHYKYILAPNTANNFAVVESIKAQFPDLVIDRRMKAIYKKDSNDVLDDEGGLLVNANPQSYIYVKIDVSALSQQELDSILSKVEQVQIFERNTQPFNQYWL